MWARPFKLQEHLCIIMVHLKSEIVHQQSVCQKVHWHWQRLTVLSDKNATDIKSTWLGLATEQHKGSLSKAPRQVKNTHHRWHFDKYYFTYANTAQEHNILDCTGTLLCIEPSGDCILIGTRWGRFGRLGRKRDRRFRCRCSRRRRRQVDSRLPQFLRRSLRVKQRAVVLGPFLTDD